MLEDRGIIFVSGLDTKDFLQNLITNDINKVDENNSCFAALLTPQGKYLFDFIIVKHKNGYFIDCEKIQVEELLKQLNIYKLRSKVDIMNLSNEFVVAAFNLTSFKLFKDSRDIPGFTFKYREDPVLLDPRNKKLGGRLIINLEKLYLSIKNLNLKPSDPKEYYEFSHRLGIPQKNSHKLKNKLFGIECNFEELNGIDFKKGCYVGQENTARIKLKDKLSKKLFPIKVIKGEIYEGDSLFVDKDEVGKVLIDKEYCFGLFKYNNNSFKINGEFKNKNAIVKIIQPN